MCKAFLIIWGTKQTFQSNRLLVKNTGSLDWTMKGSVPVRPGEKKIRKFENQNCVHCLVSMCSSTLI